jgi:ubiquinone/menaquinone biosynthesis C-methylase UbiE
MNKESQAQAYYGEVAAYYDDDARDFEQRYEENPVLKRIRQSFRRITDEQPFTRALEIGCGPGFDVEFFARRYPDRHFHAIDISPEMIRLARKRCDEAGIGNVEFATGSVEDIARAFGDLKFDLIFVYFGGLNTVYDLSDAARQLRAICTDDARLVLTFVNRYYITEIPLWLVKGRVDRAFERIRNRWRGYSDHRKIPSRVLSRGDITRAFGPEFTITRNRGYSVLYPAWYRSHLLRPLGRVAELLWRADELISATPLRNTGEYSLYVMRPISRPVP